MIARSGHKQTVNASFNVILIPLSMVDVFVDH